MQPGFRSGAGSLTSNTFKFSATDEAVSKQLEELTGKTVKVHYLQYRNALPWRGEDYGIQNAEQGQYVVDKVLEVPAALAPVRQRIVSPSDQTERGSRSPRASALRKVPLDTLAQAVSSILPGPPGLQWAGEKSRSGSCLRPD